MRDIQKAVEDYRKRFYHRKHCEGSFSISDYRQIVALARQGDSNDFVINAIGYALEAGFMVGYRRAMKEMKEKQAK